MKKARSKKSNASNVIEPYRVSLANFIYYLVISLAALAGLTSVAGGANLEVAIMRALGVLLVSIILGYGINIVYLLTSAPRVEATVIDGISRPHLPPDRGNAHPMEERRSAAALAAKTLPDQMGMQEKGTGASGLFSLQGGLEAHSPVTTDYSVIANPVSGIADGEGDSVIPSSSLEPAVAEGDDEAGEP